MAFGPDLEIGNTSTAGAPGPAGPVGPAGPPGAQGIPGPPGTTDHSLLTNLAYATASHSGFVPDTRTISTTAPLTGGGNLSADRTIAIPVATSIANGYLSASDWTTFNAKQAALSFGNLTELTSAILTIGGGTGAVIGAGTTITVAQASGASAGYLSATDWTTFNSKQAALSFGNLTELTSAVLTIGGGTGAVVGSGVTITVAAASGASAGYLSAADWTTFNGKQAALSFGNLTELTSAVLTIGGGTGVVIGTGTTITVAQASGASAGYLSAADWTTFNGKQAALSFGNLTELTSAVLTIGGGTGAVIGAGTTITVAAASGASAGYLSAADWTTFNGKQAALSFGNLTELTSAVLTIGGGTGAVIGAGTTITVAAASGASAGYLSAADWTTFNGKQAALSFGNLTELTSAVLTIGGGTGAVIGAGTTITVALASGASAGYLSAADWTTFNGKANALSGTSGRIAKFTSATGIGDSVIFEATGKIGIGATPAYPFHVTYTDTIGDPGETVENLGAAAGNFYFISHRNSAGNFGIFRFLGYDTTPTLLPFSFVAGGASDLAAGAYKGYLDFATSNNAAPAVRMRIDYLGNVGIGTTSPGYKLHVVGDAYISGSVSSPSLREKLSAARTYYVRTNGNDANTGLVNDAAGAFLTVQKAVDVASNLDLSGKVLTIQIADGTYNGGISITQAFLGAISFGVIIQGNAADHNAVILDNPAGTQCVYVLGIQPYITLHDLKVQCTGGSGARIGINCESAFLNLAGVNFGVCTGQHVYFASGGCTLYISENYTIAGGASHHIYCSPDASVYASGITVTLSGTPGWSGVGWMTNGGVITFPGCTFSGSATGVRYSAIRNGVIETSGGGANYFPGNAAGSVATQGQYF